MKKVQSTQKSVSGQVDIPFITNNAQWGKTFSLPVGRGNIAPCDILASQVNSISHLINRALFDETYGPIPNTVSGLLTKIKVIERRAVHTIEHKRQTRSYSDLELLRTRVVPHLTWLRGAGKSTYNLTRQMSKVHVKGTDMAKMVIDTSSETNSNVTRLLKSGRAIIKSGNL